MPKLNKVKVSTHNKNPIIYKFIIGKIDLFITNCSSRLGR